MKVLVLLLLSIFGWAATVSAQADFYKGKTITVYIGTTPGALYDQWGRILATHMRKHIPGNPDVIVQNMPGAGHMIAANYVYRNTKPDGLSLIGSIVPTLYFDQLVGRKEAQYDWAKFVWIGSPDSVAEVSAAMQASPDYDTFTRGTAFMMTAGGPNGRAALLAVPIRDFDARAQEYYAKVRQQIQATSYESLQAQFARYPAPGPLTDAELKQRLAAMYRSYGIDDRTSPRSILASGLPKSDLIAQLTRIRSRMLQRVSDEALSDVRVTNAMLNVLYYRP